MSQEEKSDQPQILNNLYADVPFEAYCAAQGINASGLKDILVRPSYYQYRKTVPMKASADMRLGSLIHAAILEPKRFEQFYRARPDFKVGKNVTIKSQVEAWESELPDGAISMTNAEEAKVLRLRDKVFKNALARRYLAKGTPEGSIWWQDPLRRVLCKARPDFVSAVGGAIIDVKTTKDASPDKIARIAANLRYDLQATHYLEAGKASGAFSGEEFYFLFVETEGCEEVCLYELDDVFRGSGQQWRDEAMSKYCECLSAGVWPGLPENDVLEAPKYMKFPPLEGEEDQG